MKLSFQPWITQIFLYPDTKRMSCKRKVDKLDFIKIF